MTPDGLGAPDSGGGAILTNPYCETRGTAPYQYLHFALLGCSPE
jgi:hypothetical protein